MDRRRLSFERGCHGDHTGSDRRHFLADRVVFAGITVEQAFGKGVCAVICIVGERGDLLTCIRAIGKALRWRRFRLMRQFAQG